MINKLNRWHKTKPGLLFFAVLELALAYGFVSLAIDKGNLWYYLFTLVFLVGFLQNVVALVVSLSKRNKLRSKR